jgi:alpha-beta hydrolase superfamily lysophospholipase
MPTFPGVQGDVFYRAWLVDDPIASYVFLHGFGEHSGLYERFALALNDAQINLWALDQIGHGHTGGERGLVESIDDLVANGRLLTSIPREAAPELPIVLAGHSLGGVAAALTIARDPSQFVGAVLSGTPLSRLSWVEAFAGDDEAELSLELDDLSADPWYLDALENDPLSFTSAHGARTLGATFPPAWAELEQTLDERELPILLVQGELDPIAPLADAQAWVERLPNGTLVSFEGAKHDILNETVHADVAAAIVRFVRQVALPDSA